mgnify:CR=1 FL=1
MRPDSVRELCAGLFSGALVEVTHSPLARMLTLRIYPERYAAAYLKLEFMAYLPIAKLRDAIGSLDVAYRATVADDLLDDAKASKNRPKSASAKKRKK